MNTTSNIIWELMKARKSQYDISKATGIHHTNISKYLRLKSQPNMETYTKIILYAKEVLGTEKVNQILTEESQYIQKNEN